MKTGTGHLQESPAKLLYSIWTSAESKALDMSFSHVENHANQRQAFNVHAKWSLYMSSDELVAALLGPWQLHGADDELRPILDCFH